MSARKINGRWYVDFRFGPQRYRLKSRVNTRSGAITYEAHLILRLMVGKPIQDEPEKKVMTFEAFSRLWMENYVTVNNKHSEIIHKESALRSSLLPFFGKLPLDKITAMKIEEYKSLMMKKKGPRFNKIMSPKTLKNYLGILHRCLKIAVEWGYLKSAPPIRMPKIAPSNYRYLTYEESERLLAAASGIWQDMILLGLKAGLRFCEIIALTWGDFDFENRRLSINKALVYGRLVSPKSNRIRYVDLHERICQRFQSHQQHHEKDQLLFTNEDGGYIKYKLAYDELEKIYQHAGLQPMGWHALRHTCASHLASKGAPLIAVQSLLGHSDVHTTMRYAHLCPSISAQAVALLD